MPTVLFDIDGTLMNSAGAGSRALARTANQLLGCSDVPSIPVHGRTDYAIFSDVLAAFEIEFDSAYREWRRHYHHWLEQELFVDGPVRAELLPGVNNLLGELAELGWHSTLITGNSERAASLKLRAVEIDKSFVGGGFGDWSGCRNQVAREAVQACISVFPNWCVTRSVMIGDTIHDVECAKAVDMAVVGVATGGSSREALQNAGATLVVDFLTELDASKLARLIDGRSFSPQAQ